MNRSAYSLVLMDEVIQQIDELAYAMHTSRSNLINQILAERVQMVTPEMRYQDVFRYLEQAMEQHKGFQWMVQPAQAMISMKSPLQYKYRPVIRYSVELYREPGQAVGELRVSVRTQSQQLQTDLQDFAELWAELEQKHMPPEKRERVVYQMEPGKLARTLVAETKQPQNHEQLAKNIENYLTMFDDILKRYFAKIEDPYTAQREAGARYEEYVQHGLPKI